MYKVNVFSLFFILLFQGIVFTVHAQQFLWSADSAALALPDFGTNRFNSLLKLNDPVSYLTYPVIRPIKKRVVDLREGEGKHGFWLEGNLTNRFTIYKGKYFSSPLFQRMRLTFDVGMTPRLTRDTSSPLLPLNNRFGLGLDVLLSSIKNMRHNNPNVLWFTSQLHHYSNGQANSFFISGPVKRNNYRSGDFSTDYYRILLQYAHQPFNKAVFSTGVGFQQEIDLVAPLVMSDELYHYYGKDRLLFNGQLTFPPKFKTRNLRNRGLPDHDSVTVIRKRQISFRTEMEYIMYKLENFPGTNKYRLGGHFYVIYSPSLSNDVGFLFHAYAGRDYLNIRFDDIVWIAQFGIYARIR